MSGLHIGHTMDGRPFTLPVEFVTSRYAVVAISGYGKTILGTKMAEQLIKLNQPFIALDVVGNWWGLRVGVGSHPGFPVLVVGGRKADLPLEASQGRRYAHALASSELPVVVDLSTTPLDDRWKWTADFCSELLMIQPGHPRHVFFEELKELASQTPRNKWHRRSTDAIDSFCTMGRNYGYGYTVIGQRTAIMAKGPLNQAGALFAMRLQGTQDIGSIMEWIENNGPDLESFGGLKAFKKELTKLEKGEAFYVNPSDVQPLVKIKVGPRETMHPAEAMRVNSKVLKTALMTDIRGFADKLAKELTKTVIQVVPGPDLPEKRSKTKREAGPFPVPPVDRTSKEEERLLRENGELRQEVQKLREAVANEQRAAKSAEARLGAVREALRPQYDALRGLFEQLLVGPSDGAVDRGPYGKWLSKAPAAGIRSMLEYLLDNGEATRQQLSTIAGVSTRSGYDYIGWMKRNNLVESNGQKIVLRRI